MLNPDDLAALDLYDPNAPDAKARLALLDLALEHGATIEEIRSAIDDGRLHALAVERLILQRPPRMTLAEAANRAHVTAEFATRVSRALGFALPADDAVACTDAEVDTLSFYGLLAANVDDDVAISAARTTGASLSRVADADVGMVRSGVEAPLRGSGGSDVDVARQFVDVASAVLPRMYPMFEAVHRRHLVEAARRYSLWGAKATEASTTDAFIGFADVVGYSALNQRISTAKLDELIATFEQRVLDAVAHPGARLVKVIGDEAMFAAGTAASAVAVADELLDAPDLPPLRIGIATGTVLSREGDLFGPVVNLAARLEALAQPGQALVDGDTARRLDADRLQPLGPRSVPGFDAPVDVFALNR